MLDTFSLHYVCHLLISVGVVLVFYSLSFLKGFEIISLLQYKKKKPSNTEKSTLNLFDKHTDRFQKVSIGQKA